MLKGIDPLLGPRLLSVLASMGHGDEIALVDSNFPSHTIAAHTPAGSPIYLDGVELLRATEAILSVFPLDTFVDEPIRRMEVVGHPDDLPDVQRAVVGVAADIEGRTVATKGVERLAFYEEAKKAYAVVMTGEHRPYGCLLLRKGVIFDGESVGSH